MCKVHIIYTLHTSYVTEALEKLGLETGIYGMQFNSALHSRHMLPLYVPIALFLEIRKEFSWSSIRVCVHIIYA